MRIGILAVQGAFLEHSKVLDGMGIDNFQIRQQSDIINDLDGLILPGGESTVIGKLMRELGLFPIIKDKIVNGLPVFGTCAGMILLASELVNDSKIHLATMPIKVKRNAYGRQLGSFYTEADFMGSGEIPMRFIRAPYIEAICDKVQPLAYVNGNIVAARYKNQLVTSFHPELTHSIDVHQYFFDIVKHNSM